MIKGIICLVLIMKDIWPEVAAILRERLGKQNFESWIKPLRIASSAKNAFVLQAPNKLHCEWLREHFITTIEGAAASIAGHEIMVTLSVDQNPPIEESSRPSENLAE